MSNKRRRFSAGAIHGSEKSTVCATENVESEKLLTCAHLSLAIGFFFPLSMTQYTRELIGGKEARQQLCPTAANRVPIFTLNQGQRFRFKKNN